MKDESIDATKKIETFFDERALYDKVLQHNYMFHAEMYAHTQHILQENFSAPFTLLDVGCGDARYIASILDTTTQYTGVDVSQVSLDYAQQTLVNLSEKPILIQDDLSNFLHTTTHQYDVILSSYALHHLTWHQKRTFFKDCLRCLTPQTGTLILIDVFMERNEERDDYLQRWWQYLKYGCKHITSEEQVRIKEHMLNSDHPESQLMHVSMAQEAKFDYFEVVYIDLENLHRLIIFR